MREIRFVRTAAAITYAVIARDRPGSVEPMGAPISVVDNVPAGRFEVSDGGELASLRYTVRNGTLYLIHTEVPKAIEGRGYASALTHTALEYAQREHLRVVPRCPFVRAYVRRHPEYAPLVVHERGSS